MVLLAVLDIEKNIAPLGLVARLTDVMVIAAKILVKKAIMVARKGGLFLW